MLSGKDGDEAGEVPLEWDFWWVAGIGVGTPRALASFARRWGGKGARGGGHNGRGCGSSGVSDMMVIKTKVKRQLEM
jgi:hypothetical protein